MGKGSKSVACKSASHQLFKDRAKNRVDDLQGMFSDLQSARKESRTIDVALLEEQVHQMLREWKSELGEPSPATSLQDGSIDSFSSEIYRLLHLCDEEDDATSPLTAPKTGINAPKAGDVAASQQGFNASQVAPEQTFQAHQNKSCPEQTFHVLEQNKSCPEQTFHVLDQNKSCPEQTFHVLDQNKSCPSGANNMELQNLAGASQLDFHPFELHQDFEQNYFTGFEGTGIIGENALPNIAEFAQNFCPPPSAFLGPKCALWDCPRPAQGPEWCQTSQDYCSSHHATIAPFEGCPGMPPVLRPCGIGLKDNLLFAALSAKAQGKEVGIPECEGAATAKSPWNAPELFNLEVLVGETIREWLFFDKPRRAFESGNRKQRSLPDYNGRGWHESRKQPLKEFDGVKRSYYMDPQPLKTFEWHLYEYEINKCDVCALYRLELKLVDGKKIPKGKTANDTVSDLQKQMKRLSADAELQLENKLAVKGNSKLTSNNGPGSVDAASDRLPPVNGGFDYGSGVSYGYNLASDMSGYYNINHQ